MSSLNKSLWLHTRRIPFLEVVFLIVGFLFRIFLFLQGVYIEKRDITYISLNACIWMNIFHNLCSLTKYCLIRMFLRVPFFFIGVILLCLFLILEGTQRWYGRFLHSEIRQKKNKQIEMKLEKCWQLVLQYRIIIMYLPPIKKKREGR